MISSLLFPNAARGKSEAESFFIRRTSCSLSNGSKVNPLAPSSTRTAHPQRLDTSTGNPLAIASFTTKPHGSTVLG